ncbi:MAG: hypothetical protein M1818_007339 [Claussenomyces sp. TS43310]|nr:MAG: hypothetical protein M1818_007339 [Claussenomyces sp. TS43310]
MHSRNFLPLLLLPFVISSSPQHIFSNPVSTSLEQSLQIPTSYESAVLARRVLHLTALGTLSTIFPQSSSHGLEDRPANVGSTPVGLMDYIADCEMMGDPTILAIGIGTSFKNVAAGSNISLSLQWTPPYPPKSRISLSSLFTRDKPTGTLPYSAANLPRFSLIGHLESISEEDIQSQNIGKCYTDVHPDAKYWLPGNPIHKSEWTRFVVEEVYWIGGFGDRAYIGWIPVEEWKNVTRKELEEIRLPGEKKGWKEWSLEL